MPQAEVLELLSDWIPTDVHGFANETDRACSQDADSGTTSPTGTMPAFLVPVPPTDAQKAPWG